MYVENRVALVTGAATGLGLCFTKELLKNGARGVALMDINNEGGQNVIAAIESEYGPNRAIFIKGSVTNESEFEDAFKKTIETFKNIDILINNAGIANERDPKKAIEINLIGVLTGTSLAFEQYLPKYKSFENPVIVNIASVYGLDASPCGTAYTASKHGVIGIGKAMSFKSHYQATKVKVISICPGFTDTAILENVEERTLTGRYQTMLKELFVDLYIQGSCHGTRINIQGVSINFASRNSGCENIEMYVENRVALVTGAASGLGLRFAKELLKNGARGVALMDINGEGGQKIIAAIESEYGPNKAIFIEGSVANESEFEDAFKKTIETFKNIDILINNAGIGNERDPKKTIEINLIGVLTGTSLAFEQYLPKYKSFEDPVIVNIASIYGLDSYPCGTAYTASKHGVIGIGKAMSFKSHYQATKVKVISICPGFTDTAILENIEERTLTGRYQTILKELYVDLNIQAPEVVSRSLVKILDNCNTGDVWIVEDEKCYLVEIPERFALKTIKTLEI